MPCWIFPFLAPLFELRSHCTNVGEFSLAFVPVTPFTFSLYYSPSLPPPPPASSVQLDLEPVLREAAFSLLRINELSRAHAVLA